MQMDLSTVEPLLESIAERLAAKVGIQPVRDTLTFGELFALYFERHAKVRLKNTENAHYFFTAHGARWRDVQIHAIRRRDVQQWIDELGAVSPSSATRAVNMMQAIINWGIRHEVLPPITNPCRGVERFKIAGRERFLAPAELVRFKQALDEEAPLLRDFFWVCLLTGARRGNVLAMRWGEIDFDLCTWTIPASKFKNGGSHTVPLCSPALEVLRRRREHAAGEWVFPGRRTGEHLKEPKRAWQRVLERAAISNLRIHDLRRTAASYMAINGENQYVIGQMLGHRDPRATAVYARLNLEPVRAAVEAVSERWHNMAALCVVPVKQIAPVADTALAQPQRSNADRILIEAKIIQALRSGASTKKQFHQKLGGRVKVTGIELQRILSGMESTGLIVSTVKDNGAKVYSVR